MAPPAIAARDVWREGVGVGVDDVAGAVLVVVDKAVELAGVEDARGEEGSAAAEGELDEGGRLLEALLGGLTTLEVGSAGTTVEGGASVGYAVDRAAAALLA